MGTGLAMVAIVTLNVDPEDRVEADSGFALLAPQTIRL